MLKMSKKQRIIIVVGADMTGKTQIAKALANYYEIPYYKASSEHHAFMNDQGKFINDIRYADPRLVDFIRQTGTSVVMDRGFPCEFVYAEALGRQRDLDAISRIDKAYAELDALVVFCRRLKGYDNIVDDIDPNRLNSEMLKKIDKIYERYVMTQMTCMHFQLAVDDEDLEREVRDVVYKGIKSCT